MYQRTGCKQPFLFVVIVCISSIVISCYGQTPKITRPYTSFVALTDTSLKTYLALGDSYTAGESVLQEERFPEQVVKILRRGGIDVERPDIIATTGWTTADLINRLHKYPPANTYTWVSLLIGVNNQYQGRDIAGYGDEFSRLLDLSVTYAGGNKNHVFVLSIPDYGITPFGLRSGRTGISSRIDSFNSVNRSLSEKYGVNYLDITPVSREAERDPSLTAADGLHPSASQYRRWARLLAPVMKQSL